MKKFPMSLIKWGTLAVIALTGCHSVDVNDSRIPSSPVYVPFTTISDWETYGVGGADGIGSALQTRVFNREAHIPSNYFYPDYSYTGYGGLLLVGDVHSIPRCFDMSCPVERQRDKRVAIDPETNLARCPWCGSTYDVFCVKGLPPGYPVGGIALDEGYSLRNYSVIFGGDGRYALLSR